MYPVITPFGLDGSFQVTKIWCGEAAAARSCSGGPGTVKEITSQQQQPEGVLGSNPAWFILSAILLCKVMTSDLIKA